MMHRSIAVFLTAAGLLLVLAAQPSLGQTCDPCASACNCSCGCEDDGDCGGIPCPGTCEFCGCCNAFAPFPPSTDCAPCASDCGDGSGGNPCDNDCDCSDLMDCVVTLEALVRSRLGCCIDVPNGNCLCDDLSTPDIAGEICRAIGYFEAGNACGCRSLYQGGLCSEVMDLLFDLKDEYCGIAPTPDEIDQVLACAGCGDDECIPAGGGLPSYPDPYGEDRTICDMNDDGTTGWRDWDELLDGATACKGSNLTDAEKIALLCLFLNECGSELGDPCEFARIALLRMLISVDPEDVEDLYDCWTDKEPGDCKGLDQILKRPGPCCPPPPGHGGGGGRKQGGWPWGGGMFLIWLLGGDEAESCETEGAAEETGGPAGIEGAPVDIAHGYKAESVTDLVVPLPGTDYVLKRFYRSNAQVEGDEDPGLVGEGWSLVDFTTLAEVNATDPCASGSTRYPVIYTPNRSIDYSSFASSKWSAPGGGTDYIEEVTITDVGTDRSGETLTATAMWRHTEPGVAVLEYYRSECDTPTNENERTDHVGLLRSMEDIHGNRWLFLYDDISNGTDDFPRLDKIIMQRIGTSGLEQVAEVDYTWETSLSSYNAGRLVSVVVKRDSTETQRCEYTYRDIDDDYSEAVGIPGDLIQVTKKTNVNGSGSPQRVQITQYRYHSSGENEVIDIDIDGDSFIEYGSDHQLKAVILPEQIEYLAQQYLSDEVDEGLSFWTTAPTDLEETADKLMELEDGDFFVYSGGSTLAFRVIDLAAKVITRYDIDSGINGPVLRQYVQSACGCGGANLGTQLDYSYFTHTTSGSQPYTGTTIIKEARLTDPQNFTYTAYREHHYNMVDATGDGVAYVGAAALVSKVDDRIWVRGFEYDGNGNTTQMKMPSTAPVDEISDQSVWYEPATSDANPPDYDPSDSDGLVYVYTYTSDNRLATVGVHEGENVGTATLIKEIEYGATRDWLPDRITRYRIESPTTDDHEEVTEFEYGFHTGGGDDDIFWIARRVEAELQEENGPEGWYVSVDVYDENGLNYLSVSPDNVLTERSFQVETGRITEVRQNGDGGGLTLPTGASFFSTTSPVWGSRESGDPELVTTYDRDDLGRLLSTTRPGGVTTYRTRELLTGDERELLITGSNELVYYAEVDLPHKLGSSDFAGPATITWYNADNDVIQSSDYEVSTLTPGSSGTAATYTLGDKTAQSAVVHTLTGLVEASQRWHDLSEDPYEDTYEYDALGRLEYVTNDNGTITQREYDVLDRVIGQKVGTDTMSMFQVSNTYFDSAGGASQGTGDGNVTLSRVHVDNSTTRDTQMEYDFRNRREATINPDVPHIYTEYDNLDRPTKQVVFKGLLSNLTSALTTDDTDRGRWTETSYSQRGLVFRRAIAKDPGLAATGFLETHTWYDQAGRAVGNWSPSSPMVKTTYDAFGRRKLVYLTDRDDDDQPTQAGSHSDVYTAASYVANVGDDNVIEQVEYSYIAGDDSDGIGIGLVDLVTTHRRTHTNSSADELSEGSGAITTYMGYFYDDANRNIRTVNYGTNNAGGFVHNGGGSVPAPDQTSPPNANSSNPELVSATTYSAIGLVDLVKTPRVSGSDPYETKYVYDDLYRQIAVIENYDDITIGGMSPDFGWNSTDERWEVTGGIDDAEPDTDRVTSFVYDGSNNIIKRVAHTPDDMDDEEVQVTEYDYDYSLAGVIASKDMLAEVRYPHETNGTAGTTDEYKVTYEYNRLGELTDMTDQNGTLHTYTRDDLGRVTDDFVTFAVSSDIDEWADRIQYEYDDDEWGKLVRVSTMDGGASPTYPDDVLNEIAYEYDGLWQLTSIKMNPMGEVDMSSTTREFTYTYDVSVFDDGATVGDAHNYTRLDALGYPQIASETALDVDMTYPSGVDSRISRATGFEFNVNSASNNHTVEHEFVGMSMPVITTYPTPGFELSRYVDLDFTDPDADPDVSAGTYPSFDRFGRIIRQVWSADSGTWDPDDTPPVFDLAYTYDYNSNITARTDAREGAGLEGRDEEYAYDGLDRLIEAERIESGVGTQRALSQDWTLDMLGNWDVYNPDLTVSADEQTRTHNFANEITGIEVNSTDWTAFVHDKAGNLTYQGTSDTTRRKFTWDAWNRLRQVEYEVNLGTPESPTWAGSTRARNTYYGLHQRADTLADEDAGGSTDPTRWNQYYYDASWRLLEHRYDDLTSETWGSPPTSFTADETHHYVWGMRYIDELVYYRKAVDEGRYALTDRNFSVIGLMEDYATDSDDERIRYTPYGEAVATLRSDVNQDGTVTSSGAGSDRSVITGASGKNIGEAGYIVEADLNRDGTINASDSGMVTADNGNSITAGQVSAQGNLVGYDGYIFEPSTGMYCVRHRWYLPEVGRWGSRDPLGARGGLGWLRGPARHTQVPPTPQPIRSRVGAAWQYSDGSSLLESGGSTPLRKSDPTGLDTGILSPEFPAERERRTKCQLARACRKAVRRAQRTNSWLEGLPDCPCKIKIRSYQFPDGTIHEQWEDPDPEVWEPPSDKHIEGYHDGAARCMRSKPISSGAGQQCCYDANGSLITGGSAAGTPDMVSPGRNVIRHWWKDVRPYGWCKRAGLIGEYLKGWPPNNGNNCPTLIVNGK